jgi:diguanylate cyclase (GGDEF)-like protein
LGKGLVGSCAKNQCPVILRNTADRHAVIFGEAEAKEPFMSLMAAPIAFNNQLYGVAVCGSNNGGTFSDSKLNHLTLMTYSAASAIFCTKTRERWDYNKNLDQITGIPNHRFLTEYGAALEKDVLRNGNPVCFLSLQVSNLPELYMSLGVEYGDRLQRGIASMLSKTLPSPKYIFKFSDTTYIVILIAQQRSSALLLKQRLSQVFNKAPFFIDGQEIKLHTKLGMSCFPDNGKTLSQLIGTSLSKTTLKASFETIVSP